jgi:type IV secretory pathway VirB4 component
VKIPAHEATTAQLGAVYPCTATRTLPADAVFVGRDVFGGIFVHDPFLLYASGVLTNPNMVVLGQIGRGKSAFVKSYLFRQVAIGRRVVVLDPKGEYGPFARSLGATVIALRPGGPLCLNPLDGVGCPEGSGRMLESLSLVAELSAACLGRALAPAEHTAIELAMASAAKTCTRPTLPGVVTALLDPEQSSAREINCTAADLRRDARDVALELRRFVSGEFAGMFDGETSVGIDLHAPVVVLDLSAVYHSAALGAVLTCVSAAMQSAWRTLSQTKTFFVVDEAWAILQNAGATRFLQASLKLARARGVANVIVVHRASDFSACGSDGGVTATIAEGLLADCETLVCFAQADAELAGVKRLFGLSDSEKEIVARLRKGFALWRVGRRSFLVEHRLSSIERALVDTDTAFVSDHVASHVASR